MLEIKCEIKERGLSATASFAKVLMKTVKQYCPKKYVKNLKSHLKLIELSHEIAKYKSNGQFGMTLCQKLIILLR